MRADVDGYYTVILDIEHNAEISFDLHSVYCPSIVGRKLVDFMRTEARIKRIYFEDFPSASRGLLLLRIQAVEAFPKSFGGLVPLCHLFWRRAGGGAPLRTVSI
jgi:hypothetical protein